MISKHAETWVCKKENMASSRYKSGAELIVLDDGLQDTSIVKNVNILVSNRIREMEIIKLFAGPLREK